MEVGWRAVNSRRDEMRRKSKAATGSVIAKTLNLVFLWYYSGDHKPWQMKNDKPDHDDAHIHGIYTLLYAAYTAEILFNAGHPTS